MRRTKNRVVTHKHNWVQARATHLHLSSDSPNNSRAFRRGNLILGGVGGVYAGHDPFPEGALFDGSSFSFYSKQHLIFLPFTTYDDIFGIPWATFA
jgi:hypothetical protein